MAEWGRKDAEMAIALKRAELNRALSYKVNYDAEGHNICLALIRFKDNTIDVLTAYSNDSAIPESIRLGLNLIPNLYAFMPKTEFLAAMEWRSSIPNRSCSIISLQLPASARMYLAVISYKHFL